MSGACEGEPVSAETVKGRQLLFAKILPLACVSVVALHLIQGAIGFSLWDEGFLWYGVQRVMAGETPIRDFMAYDPGRYYFSAFLMRLLREHDIIGLRLTLAIVQAMGLCVGLWLVARSVRSRARDDYLFWLLAAVTLLAWMLPRHKMYDISMSICLVGALCLLARSPRLRNYFLAGLGVGIAAVFGRNHGLYGAAGSLGLMTWLSVKRTKEPDFRKSFLLWVCGVAVGFSPILLMAAVLPGFDSAFAESIRLLFEQGETNLPLPVPWPWTVDVSTLPSAEAVRRLLLGLFFLGLPLFVVISLAFVTRQRLRGVPVEPALAASAFLALPYAHYAFSRADPSHLAQGIFAPLIGVLVLLGAMKARLKWPLTIALSAASIWVTAIYHPVWQCLRGCVSVTISGDKLEIDPETASAVNLLRDLASRYAPNGRAVLVEPFWPGAYALLERRSPMFDSYALFRRREGFEQTEVDRIKAANPAFALITDVALDGRDQLRFRNTHPLVLRYLLDNFEHAPLALPGYLLFIAKDAGH